MSASDFVSLNSGFLLTIVGGAGACFAGCLAFILKSRCTHIKCCGCQIARDVIPSNQLGNVNVEMPPNTPTEIDNV